MQNVGFVRRSSNQLYHKNHILSYWGGTSNSSKIEVLEDASKSQDLKYIKLEWREHKTASASKNQNAILLSRKCSWRLEKTWCIKVEQWNSHKKRDHIGRKEEPKSMKFEKPKCSSCKQTEIRSRRKIIFLHTGAPHHIHEKSKYIITHHIHKTWNKSE